MEPLKYSHCVQVDWKYNESGQFWNDLCAWAVDTFGLPGDRFRFESSADYMIWRFRDPKDAFLFQLRSGGHQA